MPILQNHWTKRLVAACLLCGFVFALLFVLADQCQAVSDSVMEQKGIEGLFKNKGGEKDPRAPKKWQMALGIGSFVVAIAVVKWL